MLSVLFNHAQATVDNAIGQAVKRAIVAFPFVLAGGYGLAALTIYLRKELGDEAGLLAVAGVLVVIGLITAVAMRPRSVVTAVDSDLAASTSDANPNAAQATADTAATGEMDKELLLAALSAALPVALPGVLRLVLRNLPIVLALAVALFVFTRDQIDTSGEADGDTLGEAA